MTQSTRFEKTVKIKRTVANDDELRLKAMDSFAKAAKKQFKGSNIIDIHYKKVYLFTSGRVSSYLEFKIIGNVIHEKKVKK